MRRPRRLLTPQSIPRQLRQPLAQTNGSTASGTTATSAGTVATSRSTAASAVTETTSGSTAASAGTEATSFTQRRSLWRHHKQRGRPGSGPQQVEFCLQRSPQSTCIPSRRSSHEVVHGLSADCEAVRPVRHPLLPCVPLIYGQRFVLGEAKEIRTTTSSRITKSPCGHGHHTVAHGLHHTDGLHRTWR